MRRTVATLVALLVSVTGGCVHVTANTSQFYVAQTYLPLPPDERAKPGGVSGKGGCAAGPIEARPRSPNERFSAQVLPGMMLHVTQTSYAASRADEAIPLISEWRWTIPTDAMSNAEEVCADGSAAVPRWGRQDLLRVRSLLSGAQVLYQNPPATRPLTYYAEAMVASCGTASGSGVGLACAEEPFLNKFVTGLEFNVRGQGKAGVGTPTGSPTGQEFDPKVPIGVLADTGAPGVGPVGYGQWYAGLSGFRYPEDLFIPGAQVNRCSGVFTDDGVPNETPLAQDAPVCKFVQTSLDWSAPNKARRMPGRTLEQIPRLSLLRSGDPLLLFQPVTYIDPLDLGNSKRCNGDPKCLLEDRTMQGFVDIALLIPIMTNGGEKLWIPVGMTVAAYENSSGMTVTRIQRSTDWLPAQFTLESGEVLNAAKLADSRGMIDLQYFDKDKKPNSGSGLAIRDGKADMLFAPGDVVTTRRP